MCIRDRLRLVDGVRDALDVDGLRRARFRPDVPRASETNRSRAGVVDLPELLGAVQDLPASGEVGAFDVASQLSAGDVFVVEKLSERRADFGQVVRRNV